MAITRTLLLTTPHMTGRDVENVQRRLGVAVDGEYGPATAAAVKAWRWRTGFPNAVPGLGPAGQRILLGLDPLPATYRARARLRVASTPPVSPILGAVETMLAWARAGVKERPANSNDVPELQALAKRLRLAPWYQAMGWPWCAFSVFLSSLSHGGKTAEAGLRRGAFNALYCPTILNEARAGRHGMRVVPSRQARRGDLVIFNFDGGVVDHIGRVVDNLDAGGLRTVEGNTSLAGSQSNGGAVLVRARSWSLVAAIVRDT